MTTITAVASAVEAGMADLGIVPIENSLEGSVTETLDLLVHSARALSIQDEADPADRALSARQAGDQDGRGKGAVRPSAGAGAVPWVRRALLPEGAGRSGAV